MSHSPTNRALYDRLRNGLLPRLRMGGWGEAATVLDDILSAADWSPSLEVLGALQDELAGLAHAPGLSDDLRADVHAWQSRLQAAFTEANLRLGKS
ncbi:MAG: hypothetical protein ACLFTK_14640 [Anaerolineales bacterium]